MKFTSVLLVIAIVLMSGCRAYKRDLMLQFDEKFSASDVEKSVERASNNYVIQAGDYLRLDVFTNDGERLIDPNFELSAAQGGGNGQQTQIKERFTYLIQADGTARFPKIGTLSIEGLTINEAEELLQEEFNEFYTDAFIKLRPANRRVVVLGAVGGGQGGSGGNVVPLDNENISILEALALAGGVDQGGKVKSIRLIRGDLQEPEVFSMDLSTISGMKMSGMIVEPGDVIYVEPWRRPFQQTLSDVGPVVSLMSSTIALILVIQNSTK